MVKLSLILYIELNCILPLYLCLISLYRPFSQLVCYKDFYIHGLQTSSIDSKGICQPGWTGQTKKKIIKLCLGLLIIYFRPVNPYLHADKPVKSLFTSMNSCKDIIIVRI